MPTGATEGVMPQMPGVAGSVLSAKFTSFEAGAPGVVVTTRTVYAPTSTAPVPPLVKTDGTFITIDVSLQKAKEQAGGKFVSASASLPVAISLNMTDPTLSVKFLPEMLT